MKKFSEITTKSKGFWFLSLLLVPLFFSSCYRASSQIEPCIPPPCHPKEIVREKRLPLNLPADFSVNPFLPLSEGEMCQDWGKEYHMALLFAQDFDLYRAITGFKRALFLLPSDCGGRRLEIEYMITLSYYLGKKYTEVIYEVETTQLACIDSAFPALGDLLLILYESYGQVGKEREQQYIANLIEHYDPEKSEKLCLLNALSCADFMKLNDFAKKKASVENLLCCYGAEAKSVAKAEMLNAILPGAGYWYVGQKETAFTAFLVNALFIGATAAFFHSGNGWAALITLSLESGWYFGGIYGGGLAAKYYNEQLYQGCAERVAEKEKLFPLMMLRYTF